MAVHFSYTKAHTVHDMAVHTLHNSQYQEYINTRQDGVSKPIIS